MEDVLHQETEFFPGSHRVLGVTETESSVYNEEHCRERRSEELNWEIHCISLGTQSE